MNTLQFLVDYGAWVLFAIVFLEQAGLPIHALPLLVATGALVGADKMNVGVAVLAPLVAAVLPDLCWYYLGRVKGGRVLGLLCKISLEPDSCVRSSEDMFRRHGKSTLFEIKTMTSVGRNPSAMLCFSADSISSFDLPFIDFAFII